VLNGQILTCAAIEPGSRTRFTFDLGCVFTTYPAPQAPTALNRHNSGRGTPGPAPSWPSATTAPTPSAARRPSPAATSGCQSPRPYTSQPPDRRGAAGTAALTTASNHHPARLAHQDTSYRSPNPYSCFLRLPPRSGTHRTPISVAWYGAVA
jgi:hypothetical protein